jgi:dTDP-4-dehydrorhamnose 3,5-epimerase
MKWTEGEIAGIVVKPAVRHQDSRGWLAEMFRADEMPAEIMPVMSYVSVTRPGVARGPHEHVDQTDVFGFVGPGNFQLRLWDNRPDSPTYGRRQTILVGEDNPRIVAIPPRIVHGYANVSTTDGWVLNFPNRLFAGHGRKQAVDEIRYENVANCDFRMDD